MFNSQQNYNSKSKFLNLEIYMKLTISTWQEKLEINQPVDAHSSQTYFFWLFVSEHWVPWCMPKNSDTPLLRATKRGGQG